MVCLAKHKGEINLPPFLKIKVDYIIEDTEPEQTFQDPMKSFL